MNYPSTTRGKETELNSLNHHFSSWQYPILIADYRLMVTDCTVWFSSALRWVCSHVSVAVRFCGFLWRAPISAPSLEKLTVQQTAKKEDPYPLQSFLSVRSWPWIFKIVLKQRKGRCYTQLIADFGIIILILNVMQWASNSVLSSPLHCTQTSRESCSFL